jgi:hypothetical protein
MMDQQNFDASENPEAALAVEVLAKDHGLTLGEPEQLTIRRIRRGKRRSRSASNCWRRWRWRPRREAASRVRP